MGWGAVSLRRHLGRLLRAAEEDDRLDGAVPASGTAASLPSTCTYTTEVPWPSLRKFAQFAYVAEQYGYRYDGLDPDLRDSGTPFFAFRRLPDAAERTARTKELFPHALRRGRLPGMRAWPAPVLTLPEARGQVKLLHARISVDYYGALGRQRIRPWLIGLPTVFLLFLVVNGELHTAGLRVAGVLVAALLLTVTASRIFMRRRRAARRELLRRAGIHWPPAPVRDAARSSPHDACGPASAGPRPPRRGGRRRRPGGGSLPGGPGP